MTNRSKPSSAGWTQARRWATRRTCLPARILADDNGWKLTKQFGQPDMVIKSDDYTMPAHGQDVWFKPLTPTCNLTEARWVRAVEMRPGTMQGRRIMHHVLRILIQNERSRAMDGWRKAALDWMLMEWAVGKNYDIYRKDAASFCFRARRSGGNCTSTRSAKRFAITLNWPFILYPKGEVPKDRVTT